MFFFLSKITTNTIVCFKTLGMCKLYVFCNDSVCPTNYQTRWDKNLCSGQKALTDKMRIMT